MNEIKIPRVINFPIKSSIVSIILVPTEINMRLNRKDRILYEIYEEDKTVLIIRARTHYGE